MTILLRAYLHLILIQELNNSGLTAHDTKKNPLRSISRPLIDGDECSLLIKVGGIIKESVVLIQR